MFSGTKRALTPLQTFKRGGKVDNLQFDLVFEQGKPVEFTIEGDTAATVFLTGYFVTNLSQSFAQPEDEEETKSSFVFVFN